jgi:hypothetical protein
VTYSVEILKEYPAGGATISADPHPEADSLLNRRGGSGSLSRLSSGARWQDPWKMCWKGRRNLKPARCERNPSTAMLLAASDGKEVTVEAVKTLQVPDSVPANGGLVHFERRTRS